MAKYIRASHIRSILKGISWRIIATADTILVVLFVTCIFDVCSIESAIKIGFAEFLLKLAIYYVHERIWENKRKGQEITTKRTLYKTISWRIVATTTTFIIAGTVLESFDMIALGIAGVESVTKFILYYYHERIWIKLPLGKIRNYFLKKINL
jgi:uncharacterized membrane protein